MNAPIHMLYRCLWLQCLMAFCALSIGQERLSEANWLWCDNSEKPSLDCYLRHEFQVTEPVEQAFFHSFWDKRGKFYVNGQEFVPKPWKPVQYNRGHVKGQGGDIKALLKPGKNVLAVELHANPEGARGLMLRGEIVFASGRRCAFASSSKQFKASKLSSPGWNSVEFDDHNWPQATEIANVLEFPWYRYGEVPAIYCTDDEKARIKEVVSRGFPLEKLLAEPETPLIETIYHGNTPAISINKVLYPPFFIGGIDALRRNTYDNVMHKLMDAGMGFVILYVTPERFCRPDDTYDLTGIDTEIRRILAKNPLAYFIIEFRRDVPSRWQCLQGGDDEAVGYAHPTISDHPANSHVRVLSYASRKYRDEIAKHVRSIAEQCLMQPWGRRVAGFLWADGFSADGMPWGCNCMPDNGLRMTKAFRKFLADKYHTDQALQESWEDTGVTLKTATVPDRTQREGSGLYLRNAGLASDRRVIDYYECYHSVFTDFIDELGKNVKQALPGRLFGAYYGYVFLGYVPEGSTANFGPLLDSKNFDFLFATTLGYNLTDGLHRVLNSSLRRHNKFASIEADIRTHVGMDDAYVEKQWICRTPEETRSTIGKVVANSLFNGCGFHTSDVGRPRALFDCPETLETIETAFKLWRRFQTQEELKSESDIAVVMDPRQIWMQGHPINGRNFYLSQTHLATTVQALNFTGYSHDLMDLTDYLDSKQDYKTVVFLNLFDVTAEQREQLHKKLRAKGRTAIWCIAPGLLTKKGYSATAMSELTGISLDYSVTPSLFTIRTSLPESAGVPAILIPFGMEKLKEAPRVHCIDAEANPLARYEDGGQVALAWKRLEDGSNSVFVGAPNNNVNLWAWILHNTSSQAFTPPGFYVRRNNRLLMAFSMPNGNWPPECKDIGMPDDKMRETVYLTVPSAWNGMELQDLFTGKKYNANGGTLLLQTNLPKVWLFCP